MLIVIINHRVISVEIEEVAVVGGADVRNFELKTMDNITGEKFQFNVAITNHALIRLKQDGYGSRLHNILLRKLVLEAAMKNDIQLVIRQGDIEVLVDREIPKLERNRKIAALLYDFFDAFPAGQIEEMDVVNSIFCSPDDALESMLYLHHRFKAIRSPELGSSYWIITETGFDILNGLGAEGDQAKSKEIATAKEEGLNRYFNSVPLGEYDESKFVFVIMPFGEDEFPQAVWTDTIHPTLAKKYPDIKFIRSDDVPEPGKIDSQIFTAIRKAHAVIAEVTTKNPNVYYELGLAHALNKRVFVFAQSGGLDLPFDTKVVRAEPYKDIEDLIRLINGKVTL